MVTELLTFYIRSKKGEDPSWTVNNPQGELDILRKSENSITCIECKYNINNVNIENAISKLKNKMSEYEGEYFTNFNPECITE